MLSGEIRDRFVKFFEKRGHVSIPSASLVPDEADKSVLFTTAGMQPLVPYLMGSPHPSGKRLVNVQKCVRTQDIEEVGDSTHDTFFEMLGNWSLGDYFKEDAIKWSYELLTNKEEGFGLEPKRLYITIFKGDENVGPDEDAKKVWLSLGVPENRIYYRGVGDNWWPAVKDKSKDTWTGPTGPDTEMFYDITPDGLGDMTPEEFGRADDEQKVVEIWNDVFMQYEKVGGEIVGELKVKNVDTGAGLERLAMVLQGEDNIFDTDLFAPIIQEIETKYGVDDIKVKRIVADHVRTSVFMIADGVTPSNTDRGYILRRILRRAIFQTYKFTRGYFNVYPLIDVVIVIYGDVYPELDTKRKEIHNIFETEETKFMKTLKDGYKQLDKGVDPFILFTSYGFPIELTEEIAREKGVTIDRTRFDEEMQKHQDLSRKSTEQKFKSST